MPSRPITVATALPRSTSKPITVVPSVSMNSLGAYEASVPKASLPSEAMSAGTSAAMVASSVTVGVLPVASLDSSLPHAVRNREAEARAQMPTAARRWLSFTGPPGG